ncbi:MAG: hypothetical protein QFF03_17670 [Pseudomonadota bacterium]|nr:hypothetical protein [Pseudomonadota bacterium]
MNRTNILLAAFLGTLFSPAFAADADPAQSTRTVVHESVVLQSLDGMAMPFPALRMHGKPVKGAPYSAEVVSERQQNLADGNQIINKTSSFSYRDGAGRTRQEMHDAKGEVLTVVINDNAAGALYTLNPRTRTATKLPTGLGNPEERKALGEAARARVEQLRKDGKLPAIERREIIIRQSDGADGKVHMQIERNGTTSTTRMEAPNITVNGSGSERTIQLGALGGAMADMKWASKATTKELGTRDIEGVKAEGKLRSYEIPAGEMGNRNAITVSDETWYAPELQVTVMSKHSDPRSGDSVYRLAGIKRDEPAASLFAVPSDYTVKDRSADVARIIEKKAP